MKQFKVGDTVRLKENMKVGNVYGKYEFELFRDMAFEGAKTIEWISPSVDIAKIDGWNYPFDMLMKVPKKKSSDD